MERQSEEDEEGYQGHSPYCYHAQRDLTTCGYTDGYALWALPKVDNPSDDLMVETTSESANSQNEGFDASGGYSAQVIDISVLQGGNDGNAALQSSAKDKETIKNEQEEEVASRFRKILQPKGEKEERCFRKYLKKLKKAQRQKVPFSIWNERFQELMRKPDGIEKFHDLARLAHDKLPPLLSNVLLVTKMLQNTFSARRNSEQCLSDDEKTIKPTKLGGIAGGDKYVVRGILFKYAMDKNLGTAWMYGGHYPNDANAMKAAGHELRYHARVIDYGAPNSGILCPLMALIDYRGFRLVATSVIPVNRNTLIYGSADAGKTVHCDFTVCNEKLNKLFHQMNLKPHVVKNTVLGACGDIEGHLGMDGNFYLLDFARLYPPESIEVQAKYFPIADTRSVFYKALRPELVARNSVPLCSDAFTGWLSKDPDYHLHNEEVSAATTMLYEQVLRAMPWRGAMNLEMVRYEMELAALHKGEPNPHTGAYGTPGPSTVTREILSKDLLKMLHNMRSAGINRRCLGVVRHHYDVDFGHQDIIYKALLYTEMAARVCKNSIRVLLRETLKNLNVPSSEPEREIVLALFNVFSGYSSLSQQFWTSTKIPEVEGFPPSSLAGDLEFYIYHASKMLIESKKEGKVYTREQEINFLLSRMLPMKLAIKAKFGNRALTEEEWNCADRSKPFLLQGILFQRICEMLGITLDDEPAIYDELNGYRPMSIPDPHEFMDHHILELNAKVKQMHLTAASEGFSLLQQCEDLERTYADVNYLPNPTQLKKIIRLLKVALNKLQVSIQLIPDSLQTLSSLGTVERLLGLYLPTEEEVRRRALFEESIQHLGQAYRCSYAIRSDDPISDASLLLKHTMEFIRVGMDYSCVFKEVFDHWWPSMWDMLWRNIAIEFPYDVAPLWKNQIHTILSTLSEGKAVRRGKLLVTIYKLLLLWKLEEYQLRWGQPWQQKLYLPPSHEEKEKEKEKEEGEREKGDVFIQSVEGEYVTCKVKDDKKVKGEYGMSIYGVFYFEWLDDKVAAIRHTYSGSYLCGDKEGNTLSFTFPINTDSPGDGGALWEITQLDTEERLYSFKNTLNGKWLGIQKHVLVNNNSTELKKENHFKIVSMEGSRVYVRSGYGMYLHCAEGIESVTCHNISIHRGLGEPSHNPSPYFSATMRIPCSLRNIFFLEKYSPPSSIASSLSMPSFMLPFLEKFDKEKPIKEEKEEKEEGFILRGWDGRYIGFNGNKNILTLHPTQPCKWVITPHKKKEREKNAEEKEEEVGGVSFSMTITKKEGGSDREKEMYLNSRRDGVVFMGSQEVKKREEQVTGGEDSLMESLREESFTKGMVYGMNESVAAERAAYHTSQWKIIRVEQWEGPLWHRHLTALHRYLDTHSGEKEIEKEKEREWMMSTVMALPTPRTEVRSDPITRYNTSPPTRNGWAWLWGTTAY